MKVNIEKRRLLFKEQAKTSRETLHSRSVWYLSLEHDSKVGLGECAPLFGLSQESRSEVEEALQNIATDPLHFLNNLQLLDALPSVKFALETAYADWQGGGQGILYPSAFTQGSAGIPINGLIWMNDAKHMLKQIDAKLSQGFSCIKLKIGALDFDKELELLKHIRRQFKAEQVTIRVDANGAFAPAEVRNKLERLADYDLHSIEQPIAAGNWSLLARLCDDSPLPIALDEELIGISNAEDKRLLLDLIRPQYLVLKPSLHGGISACEEWISLAKERAVAWWITSYLESNVGLNALAQWAFNQSPQGYQGLGTGQLFSNNTTSPLEIRGEKLFFRPSFYPNSAS